MDEKMAANGNRCGFLANAVAACGLAFWWPMIRTSVTGTLLTARTAFGVELLDIYCMAVAATIGVVAVGSLLRGGAARGGGHHRRCARAQRAGMGVLGVAVSALSARVLLGGSTASWECLLMAVGLAAVFVLLATLWGRTLYGVPGNSGKSVLLVFAVSFVLSFVVGGLSYLPAPFIYVRPVGAAFFACFLWALADWLAARGGNRPGQQPASCGKRAEVAQVRSVHFWMPYVVAVCLALVSGAFIDVLKSGTLAYVPSDRTLVRDVINVIIGCAVVGLVRCSAKLETARLRVTALLCILMLTGILLASFGNGFVAAVGRGTLATVGVLAKLLLYAAVISITREGRFGRAPACWTAVLFVVPQLADDMLAYYLMPALFGLLGYEYAGFWGIASLAAGLAVGIVLLSIVCLAAMRAAGPATAAAAAREPKDLPAVAGARSLSKALAARYGLSDRETDVVALILEGNTLRRIPVLLHVSEGTVQTHTKSIYRKLGIHSKQELIDAANAERGTA